MKINLIVAFDNDNCIGFSGPKPIAWHQREDMLNFKKLTTNGVVIMGRFTFESMGRPLPNRINIIVSKSRPPELLNISGIYLASSLEDAINLASTFESKKPFLIGGALLYNEAIMKDLIDCFYFTTIDTSISGDAFVYLPKNGWEQVLVKEVEADEKNQFSSKFYEMRRA